MAVEDKGWGHAAWYLVAPADSPAYASRSWAEGDDNRRAQRQQTGARCLVSHELKPRYGEEDSRYTKDHHRGSQLIERRWYIHGNGAFAIVASEGQAATGFAGSVGSIPNL